MKKPMSKTMLLILRHYAAGCLLISAILFAMYIADLDDERTFLLRLSLTVNALTIALSIILVIKPTLWQLFTLMHIMQGIKVGLWGTGLTGLLIYSTGWVIALYAGFFTKVPKLKVTLIALVFIGIAVVQVRDHYIRFLADVVRIVVVFGMFFLVYKILSEVGIFVVKNKPLLVLAEYQVTKREREYIGWILQHLTYKEMATKLNVSESTVKTDMVTLRAKFDMQNHGEFLSYLLQYEIR